MCINFKLCVKAFFLFNLLSFQRTDLICYDIYNFYWYFHVWKGSILFWGNSCSEAEFVFASNLFITGLLQEFHKPVAYGIMSVIKPVNK